MNELRKKIDEIDSKIILLLKDRILVSEQIGIIKKRQGRVPLQPTRWELVIARRKKIGKRYKLSSDFIEALYLVIHSESLRVQGE